MNFKNLSLARTAAGSVKAFLLMGFFMLFTGGLYAQQTVADVVDLLPDAVSVAADLGITSPAVHGTYTAADIEAIANQDALDQLKNQAYPNGSDADLVKYHYYNYLHNYVLNYGAYPEDALLVGLPKAQAEPGTSLSNSQLKDLYDATINELDQL